MRAGSSSRRGARAARNPAPRDIGVGALAVASPLIHIPAATVEDSKVDVIEGMEPWVHRHIESMLVPTPRSWQPADFLPDPASPDFLDAVRALRRRCEGVPPAAWLVIVGDMVTEEALPSYMSMLNRMDGAADESGGDVSAWARWTRGWTSEENRHGDLLNKLLYLCGQVDMGAVERSIQGLIGTGFDPSLGDDAYRCFVYTSFQERATKGDEARHEAAYQRIVDELFRRDPDAAMTAFAAMMEASIVMPAHLMRDGAAVAAAPDDVAPARAGQPAESRFFQSFAAAADGLGVYTASDYAAIVTHLMRRWRIRDVSVKSGHAAAAQEYLVQHEARIWRMANVHRERKERSRRKGRALTFECAWLPGRQVVV